MTLLMMFGVWMQLSPMSFEMVLGSLLTGSRSPGSYALGFLWHLLNGGIFALIYGAIFGVTRSSGAVVGALIGIGHWVVAGILINIVLAIHPLTPLAMWQPWQPGPIFLSGVGGMTLFGSFVLHLVFGAIVGSSYQRTVRTRALREAEDLNKPLPLRKSA